ncbi:MAG: hypothetical protein QOK35_398, partial [Pseudonocardiales bacterium]|nr:hypothetical protein [Pseudonocardiales bacterium]
MNPDQPHPDHTSVVDTTGPVSPETADAE